MKKIKGTTWSELDLMTDEELAQLEVDFQAVVKDCDNWDQEEADKRHAELAKRKAEADERAAEHRRQEQQKAEAKERREEKRWERRMKWWDFKERLSDWLFCGGLILAILLVIFGILFGLALLGDAGYVILIAIIRYPVFELPPLGQISINSG